MRYIKFKEKVIQRMKISNDAFYDFLLKSLVDTVQVANEQELVEHNILVLGTNHITELEQMTNNLSTQGHDFTNDYYITKKMVDSSKKLIFENMNVIISDKAYGKPLLEDLSVCDAINKIDAILYFGNSPINLRDVNILELCNSIREKKNISVFCYDVGVNSLYSVCNPERLCEGLMLYIDINKYISRVSEGDI